MDQIQTKTIISFALLDSIYWAFYACFAGFITTYLLQCGLSNTLLSIDLACFMLFAFIGAFFWGGRCDKHMSNKKIFIPEFISTVLIAVIIYFLASQNVYLSALLYPLFGFLAVPLGSNLDSWMLKSFHQDAFTYGRARGIGSAGYAIAALLVGQLINHFGYRMILIASSLCALVVLLIALTMKEEQYIARKQTEKVQTKDLLKIRPYVYMAIILFLTGLSISPYNNLKTVILKSVGGDVGMLGIDSFVGVMVQAVFIFTSGRLRKYPQYARLFVMSAFVMITMILAATATNSLMIIIGTVFNNMSYGIMLPTMREITEKNVTGSLKNTAHSLADAMYGSFSGIIALTYSGTLMDLFGVKCVAMLGAAFMAIAIIMSIRAMIREKNTKKN